MCMTKLTEGNVMQVSTDVIDMEPSNYLIKIFQDFNSLTPRVKPWVIQSFLTYDSIGRILKC